MKKIKLILFLFIFTGFKIFGQGTPVFDMSTWLGVLDQVYTAYDNCQKTLTMIEQNYEQMQFYIEQAKSFNFESIEWDGNLDFRNEIANATTQCNRYLNNVRRTKEAFQKRNVYVNGKAFSLADLCGVSGEGLSTSKDFILQVHNKTKNELEKQAQIFAEGLTDAEAAALWSKYGLDPQNYYMIQQTKDQANKLITKAIEEAEEYAESGTTQENQEYYETLSNIMNMIADTNINPTELSQISAMLQQENIYAIKDLETQLKQNIAYTAWYNQLQEQKELAEREAELKNYAEMMDETNPSFF